MDKGSIYMAILFYKTVKQRINPIVKPLGFRTHSRFYHRIVNNVVQQFCLFHRGGDFTIRFCLSSVYDINDLITDGMEIHQLIDGTYNWFGTRIVGKVSGIDVVENPYINMGPETLQKAADVCANALERYLLPWFFKATTSEDALSAERAFKTDRYRESGTNNEIGLLLDMGKYEAVAEILNYYIQNNDRYNQSWWKHIEAEYKQLYLAITQNDQLYINNYMDQKKSATYAELKWKSKE